MVFCRERAWRAYMLRSESSDNSRPRIIRIFSMVYCRDTQDAKHLCRLLVPYKTHVRLCISYRRSAANGKHPTINEEKRSFSTQTLRSNISHRTKWDISHATGVFHAFREECLSRVPQGTPFTEKLRFSPLTFRCFRINYISKRNIYFQNAAKRLTILGT